MAKRVRFSNQLLLVFSDANKEQGATGGGETTVEAVVEENMEQATVAEEPQQEQDNPDDPLDVATVDVCDDDDDDSEDEEEDEEDEYNPEEDDCLRNFINKESQVGISLGGQLGQPGPSGSKFVSLVSLFTDPQEGS